MATCPIYLEGIKTVAHLLFDCSWTHAIWFGSNLSLRITKGSIPNVAQWTYNLLCQHKPQKDTRTLFSQVATVGWFIWKSRNEFVFNHLPADPLATCHRISQAWHERLVFLHSTNDVMSSQSVPVIPAIDRWRPTLAGHLKINCDAAYCKHSSMASIVVVVRDSHGKLVEGKTQSLLAFVLQAKAYAIRLACLVSQAL